MYTRVESRFWQDEKMRAVSGDARQLMLYLLTSPHRNMIGFYFLPPPYACFDLGWDEKKFNKHMLELIKIDRISYDDLAHVVLIYNFLKFNPLENPNQVKGAVARFEELPETSLKVEFFNIIANFDQELLEQLKPFINSLETLSKPFPNPSETLSKQEEDKDYDYDKDKETGEEVQTCASDDARAHTEPPEPQFGGSVEADKVTATPETKSGPRSPFKSKRQEQLFDAFWGQYPRKRNKGYAEKAWVKLCPDDGLFANLMHGLALAKASSEWGKDGGQFIPYPATWLNAKGWEDEYLPAARDGPKCSENVEKGLTLMEKYRHQDCEKEADCV